MVIHLLTNKICGHSRIAVLETSCLDCSTIDREGIVVEKLGVKIRSKRSAWDTSSLAHLTPWLKVLVVNILDDLLEIDTGKVAHDRAIEAGLDAKDLFENLVDLLLVGIVLISKIVKSASRNIDSTVPHGSSNITNVNGAETEITRPHELHGLLKVLVYSSADDTRSNTIDITRAVDSRGTKDDKRKARDSLKISLGLKVSLGEHGPRIDLITLLGRLLASSVDLSSAQVYELLDWVLNCLSGNLDTDIMKLLLVDRFILTILCLSCTVENIIELLTIITSEALSDGASVGKVTLNELNDGVSEKGSVGGVEESSLREDLINTTDLSNGTSLHEILAKITADEASTTKNENGCHL